MASLFATVALSISFLCLALAAGLRRRHRRSEYPPEPPTGWPVIGHLRLLAGPELPHRALAAFADKYGPIFTIRLAFNRVLIVSSPEIAKELFTTKDTAALSRPTMITTEVFSYDFAVFGMGPHGDYWRESRKIAVQELLSNRRLDLLRRFKESEVRNSITDLYNRIKNTRPEVIDFNKWIGDLSLNIMMKLITGKSSSSAAAMAKFQKAVSDIFHYGGMFLVGDVIPFLRWMDIGGHEKAMKRSSEVMDGYLQGWLNEHKENRGGEKTEHDFIDVLLSHLDGRTLHGHYSDTVIKAMCLSMIAGGTDTTNASVMWAISLLLNNRDVLRKAQKELDDVVSRERMVTEGDIEKLVYLQAIVKESMRLYPATPFLAPREFVTDCQVSGYKVRKGTWLMVNIWKIQNDPNVWPDSTKFYPERFLTTQYQDVDVKGQNFELLPFGSGRRSCPGINLGLQIVHLALASFLHAFEFSTMGDEPVDMKESLGMTNMKAMPLSIVVSPRLSHDVYA